MFSSSALRFFSSRCFRDVTYLTVLVLSTRSFSLCWRICWACLRTNLRVNHDRLNHLPCWLRSLTSWSLLPQIRATNRMTCSPIEIRSGVLKLLVFFIIRFHECYGAIPLYPLKRPTLAHLHGLIHQVINNQRICWHVVTRPPLESDSGDNSL